MVDKAKFPVRMYADGHFSHRNNPDFVLVRLFQQFGMVLQAFVFNELFVVVTKLFAMSITRRG